ncbi:ATP-binding protein [Actinosynnema sp. NPDC051121]
MSSHRPPVEEIADELLHLAQRGIDHAFLPRGDTSPTDIRWLCQQAERLFPLEWQRGRNQALGALIRSGIAHLEGFLGKIPRKHAALRLFNLDSLPTDAVSVRRLVRSEGKLYATILEELWREAGRIGSESSRRRRLAELRREIAMALVDIGSNSPAVAVAPAPSSDTLSNPYDLADIKPTRTSRRVDEVPYVRRDEYHEAFDAALRSGAKVIAFVGPPGVGKKRLVNELVDEKVRLGKSSIEVESSDYTRLAQTIATALNRRGVETDLLTEGQLVRRFIRELHEDGSPDFVIVHQPRDTSLLDALEVNELRSVVILVGSQYISWHDFVVHLPVQAMKLDEAITLAAVWFPGSREVELQTLVETVGRSPQALEAVKRFLSRARNRLSVADFCRVFPDSSSLVLKSTSSDLVGRYEVALGDLRHRYDDAASLLEYMVYLGDVIPIDVLVDVLGQNPQYSSVDIKLLREVLDALLELLNNHALIDVRELHVRVHKFTRALIRQLIHSRAGEEIINHLRVVLVRRIENALREDGGSVKTPEQVFEIVGVLASQLFYVESAKGQRPGEVVAALIADYWEPFRGASLARVTPVVEDDVIQVHRVKLRFDMSMLGEEVRNQLLDEFNRPTEIPHTSIDDASAPPTDMTDGPVRD